MKNNVNTPINNVIMFIRCGRKRRLYLRRAQSQSFHPPYQLRANNDTDRGNVRCEMEHQLLLHLSTSSCHCHDPSDRYGLYEAAI